MNISIGIVVPTRNRVFQIVALLDTFCVSSLRPSQIVIVASGQDIQKSIAMFHDKLNITYVYTELAGQVAQKSLGIEYLDSNIDWCLFTDDDLLFSNNALEEAIKAKDKCGEEILGIGFSLTATSRVINMNKFQRKIAKTIGLDSELKGKVLRSGHATSYLESSQDQFTEWLNGVSMWRVDMAKKYSKYVPLITPASCEDLVFSYEMAKKGKLLFASKAKVEFQLSEKTNAEDFEILSKSAIWRLYFVLTNRELSLVKFLISQIFRILYVIFIVDENRLKQFWKFLLWYFRFSVHAIKLSRHTSKEVITEKMLKFILQ